MPIIKSAAKRVRQTSKRHARNAALKREIKDAVKAFLSKPSTKALSNVQSKLDTAVKKNLLKKNTVARRKAQLAKVAKKDGLKISKAPIKKAASTKTKPAAKKTPAKKPTTKKTAKN